MFHKEISQDMQKKIFQNITFHADMHICLLSYNFM